MPLIHGRDIAIALDTARRARAEGGGQRMLPLNGAPGAGAREAAFQGPLKTPTPGRTDRHKINVRSGSYVVPADIVSILGEGNTDAGHAVLAMMFPPSHIRSAPPHPPHGVKVKKEAAGGAPDNNRDVPIIAAGGEHVLSPDRIASRFPNINQGHDELDNFVRQIRKQEIERLRKAPPPKT